MKDLKIEYRDGRLVELRVDGVLVNGVTAMHFSHVVGDTVPRLTLTTGLTGTESLSIGADTPQKPRYIHK
ncbi:serine acetyltransferase [Mixta mediterraneensis]|uniref:serine acetyltransferase n=1 Tax=Mixta mediterraneensis TaxID=2758443 RepID=UPI001876CC06|nr:serine acetyltransferase [Mixta mediterraneensis]MBE5251739.1 serine acetyltransferase [Mixta mediterraneensis]